MHRKAVAGRVGAPEGCFELGQWGILEVLQPWIPCSEGLRYALVLDIADLSSARVVEGQDEIGPERWY